MSSDPPTSSSTPPLRPADAALDHGLPPVQPPTGQMILRLFMVPALIVGVLVGLFLLGPTLYGWMNRALGRSAADTRSAEQFLRDLDNPNPEVRWRAASDLAQVLLRKDSLASDVDFARELSERLQAAIEHSAAPEKEYAQRQEGLSTGEKARELAKLEPDRNLIIYLGACLGNCMIPIGAPLLKQLAVQETGLEAEALAERRRRALFALATLGENLKRYDRLPDAEKDAVENQLTPGLRGRRAQWDRESLAFLEKRRSGKPDTMGVVDVLKTCATDDDPFLRELAALASNFWIGSPTEEKVVEQFLITLSNDSGVGEEQLSERISKNPNDVRARSVTTQKGFKVQANATVALARRGSPHVRLDVLAEMLEPERLGKIFVVRTPHVEDKPDEALIVLTLTDALKALALLHQKRPEMKLERFVPLVESLTQYRNVAVRNEALQTQRALEKS